MAGQASLVLLRPFREVIKWASLAAVYAQDASSNQQAEQLRRASSTLLREADRAVKRLTGHIESPTPQLNTFLTDLVLRNPEVIAEYRAIDSLLYDFEDYIEASSFDERKFAALSAAIKALALLLLERIQRFTAETALDLSPPPNSMGPLRPLPPLPPGPARANMSSERVMQPSDMPPRLSSKFTPVVASVSEVKPPQSISVTTTQLDNTGDLGIGRLELGNLGSPISMSPTPPPQLQSQPPPQPQPQPLPLPARPGSAASSRANGPQVPLREPLPRRDRPYRPRMPSLTQRDQIHEEDPNPVNFDSYPSPPPPPPPDRSVCTSPETEASRPDSYRPSHMRRTSSSASRWPQANEYELSPGMDRVAMQHQSYAPSSQNTYSTAARHSTFDHNSISSGATSHSSHGSVHGSSTGLIKSKCSIGQDSSLSLLGGFCKGARAFAASGPGQAIKKVGGNQASQAPTQGGDYSQEMFFGSMLAVDTSSYSEPMAQCVSCEYQTIYSQLLQDMDNDPLAKRQARSITYRSRFLYKSHVAVKDNERIFFACVFCDKTRSTCHEGDATVFQSPDHLFRHIARHPLPLPNVAGVTVLYEEPKGPAKEHFDLIIPTAPAQPPGPPADALSYIASLPSARANKDHIRRRNGKPQDRPDNVSEVLQFLANARILGVEYPDKWDGKWCQGWHDGVLGVFPSKIIQLETPENVQAVIKSVPRSLRSGVAKWEWDPKARVGTPSSHWLTFSKGSKISNLTWDDPHAWYWVGINSKGRLGIFPKSHIRIETIQDGSLGETQPTKPSGRSWLFGKKG